MIRRWIRSGKPVVAKDREQHVIEEDDLDAVSAEDEFPIPASWGEPVTGPLLPSVVGIIRNQRAGH